MAYRPSKRSSRSFEPLEINIFPMLNLMVILIPLLLSTATAIKLGVIELNLPQAVGGPGTEARMPTEAQRSLDLTVTITEDGLYVSSSQSVLQNDEAEGPTIPMSEDGNYDYAKLSSILLELKQRIINSPLDTKRIILQAGPDIEYQILVSTMDACRSIIVENSAYELFPNVSISAGIIS